MISCPVCNTTPVLSRDGLECQCGCLAFHLTFDARVPEILGYTFTEGQWSFWAGHAHIYFNVYQDGTQSSLTIIPDGDETADQPDISGLEKLIELAVIEETLIS